MDIDIKRLNQYLYEIKENTDELKTILGGYRKEEILSDKISIKAIKYTLIEIAEAVALVLQHILAKGYGMPVKGYIDTIRKAHEKGIIDSRLYESLKPFFDFRNTLIHRYWEIKDEIIIQNLYDEYMKFYEFIDTIRSRFISSSQRGPQPE